MWNVEGKEFDAYYKAYEYAMDLSALESRDVEILKDGVAKGVTVRSNRPMTTDY